MLDLSSNRLSAMAYNLTRCENTSLLANSSRKPTEAQINDCFSLVRYADRDIFPRYGHHSPHCCHLLRILQQKPLVTPLTSDQKKFLLALIGAFTAEATDYLERIGYPEGKTEPGANHDYAPVQAAFAHLREVLVEELPGNVLGGSASVTIHAASAADALRKARVERFQAFKPA